MLNHTVDRGSSAIHRTHDVSLASSISSGLDGLVLGRGHVLGGVGGIGPGGLPGQDAIDGIGPGGEEGGGVAVVAAVGLGVGQEVDVVLLLEATPAIGAEVAAAVGRDDGEAVGAVGQVGRVVPELVEERLVRVDVARLVEVEAEEQLEVLAARVVEQLLHRVEREGLRRLPHVQRERVEPHADGLVHVRLGVAGTGGHRADLEW